MYQYHESFAVLALRLLLGILFFFQGYDKVFRIKVNGVVESFRYQMESRKIGSFWVNIAAIYTSYVELLGGLLLILGFFKYYTLYALGIDLLVAATAFSIIRPMWDMQFLFPRFVILVTLLLLPPEWDYFSLDNHFNLLTTP